MWNSQGLWAPLLCCGWVWRREWCHTEACCAQHLIDWKCLAPVLAHCWQPGRNLIVFVFWIGWFWWQQTSTNPIWPSRHAVIERCHGPLPLKRCYHVILHSYSCGCKKRGPSLLPHGRHACVQPKSHTVTCIDASPKHLLPIVLLMTSLISFCLEHSHTWLCIWHVDLTEALEAQAFTWQTWDTGGQLTHLTWGGFSLPIRWGLLFLHSLFFLKKPEGKIEIFDLTDSAPINFNRVQVQQPNFFEVH